LLFYFFIITSPLNVKAMYHQAVAVGLTNAVNISALVMPAGTDDMVEFLLGYFN
tara:strand:- start:466 stop:627 length:162 start_codon:yes stop_codon:yes gene_type:complete